MAMWCKKERLQLFGSSRALKRERVQYWRTDGAGVELKRLEKCQDPGETFVQTRRSHISRCMNGLW